MRSVSLAIARDYWRARGLPLTRKEFIEFLKTGWVLVVLFVAGVFAVVTAILIAWPALAYLAAKFFG